MVEVKFVVQDVMDALRITEEQAETFLDNNARYIEEAMTEAGFHAIETLGLMDGFDPKGDDPGQDDGLETHPGINAPL